MPAFPRAAALARLSLVAGAALSAMVAASFAAGPVDADGAKVRLIAAGTIDGRPALGLEIALQPGWKTYWRAPGDAGIPPLVDWSRSTGVTALAVRFPAPVRFGEEGVRSIGYTAPVILPLDVTLADPTRPATLDLTVQIGICHDICVPVAAHLGVDLTPGASVDPAAAARLAQARALLPVPASADTFPRIVEIVRHDEDTPPTITVDVGEPRRLDTAEVDLLVEGPSSDWSLPLPAPVMVRTSPGRSPSGDTESGRTWIRSWEFTLDGAPAGADLKTARLRFTLRSGTRTVEQTVALDGTGVLP